MTRCVTLALCLLLTGCTPHRPPVPPAPQQCPSDSSMGLATCQRMHPLDIWDDVDWSREQARQATDRR